MAPAPQHAHDDAAAWAPPSMVRGAAVEPRWKSGSQQSGPDHQIVRRGKGVLHLKMWKNVLCTYHPYD